MHNNDPIGFISCHLAGCEIARISCRVAGLIQQKAELTATKNLIYTVRCIDTTLYIIK